MIFKLISLKKKNQDTNKILCPDLYSDMFLNYLDRFKL
jgi:hypothetical protein